MLTPLQVKALIPHTWPLFFVRHGRFTPVQQQAIPPILAGNDVLIVAVTASGKTEAVVAPLLERYWPRLIRPDQFGLGVLYVCPTRALVADLYERLRPALADTVVTLAMKTGDTGPVNAKRPPAVLLTTPESVDSLLTRTPRLFAPLQALVIDEVHLFDNTVRGDHVRCLLPRLERIRHFADPHAQPLQRVALSATVPDREGVARRYLSSQATIVDVPGGREIVADIHPLSEMADLVDALAQRATGAEPPARKSLVFCNTRAEVEAVAAYLRRHLPYQTSVFVHYSNLDARLRRDVENQFATAAVAVCVCTSTLELGIDIGSVDDVVLLGAPPTLTSFLQRIGRGSRRSTQMSVLCLAKSPGEWARFDALLDLAAEAAPDDGRARTAAAYGFRPSVLIQQIFSLIKQSPTGSVRLADVRRIAPAETTTETVRQIVSQLTFAGYLRPGRLGEWRPADRLQELVDRHEIYSNIGPDALGATAVDAYSGNVIGQTERVHEPGSVVLLGGRPMEVVWRDKYRFGLAAAPDKAADEILRFRQSAAPIPFVVTQAVARALAIEPGQMVTVPAAEGTWLYHFLGSVWGELLAALLLAHALIAEPGNEFCLYVRPFLGQLPPLQGDLLAQTAKRLAATLAGRLEMGRFHELLPRNVAVAATVRQLDLERFAALYATTTVTTAAPALRDRLQMLR